MLFSGCAAMGLQDHGDVSNQIVANNDQFAVWVYFTDKGPPHVLGSYESSEILSERALERRAKHGITVGFSDYPVYSKYIARVAEEVEAALYPSRWFNALHIKATEDQIYKVADLDFVDRVGRARVYEPAEDAVNQQLVVAPTDSTFYGESEPQLNQIDVPAVHEAGIYGQGVLVGLIDTGFRGLDHLAFDSLNIVARYDFADRDTTLYVRSEDDDHDYHGAAVLSVLAGYKPGRLIGPAFGAEFALVRIHGQGAWVRALEWADSVGVDVINASLGLTLHERRFGTYYAASSMDGDSNMITRASDIAASKGIVMVTSAGNGYDVARDSLGERRDPNSNTINAPADGDMVLSVGAVDGEGSRASLSSVGPTADGRIKPDLSALGQRAFTIQPSGGYVTRNGTSFSSAFISGVAALVISACPEATSFQVIDAMKRTASNAETPDNEVGWGIVSAEKAIRKLCKKL